MKWNVDEDMSKLERAVAAKLKRVGKLFVFLRQVRHELFDAGFQHELSQAYRPRGQEPVAPALLAMVTLLQAYTQTGDANAVVTAQLDMRWQLVLGTLGQTDAPFSQGSLVRFRERLIAHDLDKKLVERTVELAKKTGGFGWQKLRAALDSSPLLGAGRVEDCWNLIGRAIRQLVGAVSKVLDVPPADVIAGAGLSLVVDEATSVKSLLDIDWDDATERNEALQMLLKDAEALRAWVEKRSSPEVLVSPQVCTALDDLARVTSQDLEPDPDGGGPRIRRGVARDRMPSLGDREMRHGRKSKEKPFTGYKRHVVRLVDQRLIVDAIALPANQAEHQAAHTLLPSVERHGPLDAVLIDRGYLASPTILSLVNAGVDLHCKPWTLRNNGLFTKEDFTIALEAETVTCPAGAQASFGNASRVARFPATRCHVCQLRDKCTTSTKAGRTVTIHPNEALLIDLRRARKTPEGRAKLRDRVVVEHGLARVGQIQGKRARYKGVRKNTLDLRRTAAVANLIEVNRVRELQQRAA